ncbi:hypothetical protein VMCG_01622 [Cytospora schulzeri]|uniref:Uncharacterized protein n=1 Tax=Cytospora schulzeri TaxID=448051 RepID=A0A423X4G6_9PEZI|nr:hypothetical protein VMCG_01622 [Valsa malicola]
MPNSGGRMLSRVRSHRKLRTATAAEVDGQQKHHRRQHSDNVLASAMGGGGSSSTTSSSSQSLSRTKSRDAARTHWPPIEWDPLKLNPPTPPVADLPARPRGDSLPGHPTRSFGGGGGGHERRRPRMHHSDSGFSLLIHDGFDFGFERPEGHHHHLQQQQHDDDDDDDEDEEEEEEDDDDVHMKGWPSPASSVDSGKSWFEDNDDDGDDEDGAVKRSNELWGQAPTPRRRPQVASPDDPNYFIQRGGWKRKGIVFGGKTEEVRQKDDEVFNVI